MGGRRSKGRKIIKNYTGEASVREIRLKILKLLKEEKERGITTDAGKHK